MPTGAKLGYGSLLKMGNGASPEVFSAIAEVSDIGEFGAENALVEVTNFDSPNAAREYIYGLSDGVELSVTANFRPDHASQNMATGLLAAQSSRTTKNFQLALTSGFGTFSFAALVRSWRIAVSTPEQITATFNLKVTGSIAYTA